MKKAAAFTLATIYLLALGAVCPLPVKAQYPNEITNITINADGGVTPSTPFLQQVGNTYTLTHDLKGAITVHRSNTTFNGDGHTIFAAQVYGVSNVTLENCNVIGGEPFGAEYNGIFAGISLSYASEVTVANNTITGVSNFVLYIVNMDTIAGIIVQDGQANTISGNSVTNNWEGMIFVDTSNNLVVGNNLTSDASYETGYSSPGGMYFDHSSNNTIYHNNFEISIGGEALDSYYGSSNVWDDGFPFGGNYWTDYQKLHPNATEIDSSGIGNMPYVIDGPDNNSTNLNNTDRYPLIRQFTSTFSALQTTAPKITILSPVNQTFNESNVILSFSVDVLSPVKSIDWIGYSINGGLNVTVTNNSPIINVTIPNVTVGLNVLTVYANDSYGNSADPQTINFTVTKPVTPTIITLAVVLLISTTVIAGTGLTIFFKKRKKQAQKLYK